MVLFVVAWQASLKKIYNLPVNLCLVNLGVTEARYLKSSEFFTTKALLSFSGRGAYCAIAGGVYSVFTLI